MFLKLAYLPSKLRFSGQIFVLRTLNFRGTTTVAMVTYCVTKMVTTCLPMVGQFFDTMVVASSDKEWL